MVGLDIALGPNSGVCLKEKLDTDRYRYRILYYLIERNSYVGMLSAAQSMRTNTEETKKETKKQRNKEKDLNFRAH